MPPIKVTPQGTEDFFEANKDAFVVLFFDGAFTEQSDIVDAAILELSNNESLKGRVVIGTVDVEENPELATRFSVLSVPTAVCIARGKELMKIDQLKPSKLIKHVEEGLQRFDILSGDTNEIDLRANFQEYLKRLVNRAPVMVFMKGEPSQPRCGFSRQLVELLAKNNIVYQHFDILQDEEVRQGLKEFSDWPTYPQIYAKGGFVGGLDVLKQLETSNELQSTLGDQ